MLGMIVGMALGVGLMWTAFQGEKHLRDSAAPRTASWMGGFVPAPVMRVGMFVAGLVLCVATLVAYLG